MSDKTTNKEILEVLRDLTRAVLTFTNATPDEWPELAKALEIIKNTQRTEGN